MSTPKTVKKCVICGDYHIEKTVKCIIQQMLIDYTAWVNGEPTPWNVKKAEAIEAINTLRRADMEAVIGESVANDGAEIVRSVSGEARGRSAGSYWQSCRRELREEQAKRMEERLNG